MLYQAKKNGCRASNVYNIIFHSNTWAFAVTVNIIHAVRIFWNTGKKFMIEIAYKILPINFLSVRLLL